MQAKVANKTTNNLAQKEIATYVKYSAFNKEQGLGKKKKGTRHQAKNCLEKVELEFELHALSHNLIK